MYLSFYQLSKKPFQISADPSFMWFGEKHKEALAVLKYGVLDNKSFLLLTGDIGTGKTTLINALINSLGDEIIAAKVPDPGMEMIDFMNYISRAFNMTESFSTKEQFLHHFGVFLNAAYLDGRKVLLILDESQRLSTEMLEEVRLLTNIEKQQVKLLNIFFVGQNEFIETIQQKRNRALRQRISVNYSLETLDEHETSALIQHRLRIAGAEKEIFTSDALQEVYAITAGFPRRINIVCDHALLTGFVEGQKRVSAEIVRQSVADLTLPKRTKKSKDGPGKQDERLEETGDDEKMHRLPQLPPGDEKIADSSHFWWRASGALLTVALMLVLAKIYVPTLRGPVADSGKGVGSFHVEESQQAEGIPKVEIQPVAFNQLAEETEVEFERTTITDGRRGSSQKQKNEERVGLVPGSGGIVKEEADNNTDVQAGFADNEESEKSYVIGEKVAKDAVLEGHAEISSQIASIPIPQYSEMNGDPEEKVVVDDESGENFRVDDGMGYSAAANDGGVASSDSQEGEVGPVFDIGLEGQEEVVQDVPLQAGSEGSEESKKLTGIGEEVAVDEVPKQLTEMTAIENIAEFSSQITSTPIPQYSEMNGDPEEKVVVDDESGENTRIDDGMGYSAAANDGGVASSDSEEGEVGPVFDIGLEEQEEVVQDVPLQAGSVGYEESKGLTGISEEVAEDEVPKNLTEMTAIENIAENSPQAASTPIPQYSEMNGDPEGEFVTHNESEKINKADDTKGDTEVGINHNGGETLKKEEIDPAAVIDWLLNNRNNRP